MLKRAKRFKTLSICYFPWEKALTFEQWGIDAKQVAPIIMKLLYFLPHPIKSLIVLESVNVQLPKSNESCFSEDMSWHTIGMKTLIRLLRQTKSSVSRKKIEIDGIQVSLSREESYLLDTCGMQFCYGQREILLKIMDERFSKMFPVVLQHGVYAQNSQIERGVAWTPRRTFLSRFRFVCFSEFDERAIRSQGLKDVVPIGAPWLYLNNSVHESTSNNVGFFPKHYNLTEESQHNTISDIKNRVEEIQSKFAGMKLTVFLYLSEFLMQEWHVASRLLNFEIFCAGLPVGNPVFSNHSSRTRFLPNLKEKMSKMEICVFDSYSSAIIYAGSLGKTVMLIESLDTLVANKRSPFERDMLRRIGQFTNSEGMIEGENFCDFSLSSLGAGSLRSANQLKEILEPIELNILKKIYDSY